MGKVFSIISGKGGTGKSTVSVGLATALSGLKKKVLLIDLDFGLRCLDTLLGIDKSIVFDLGDWASGSDLSDVVYEISEHEGLELIAAPQKIADIKAERIAELVKGVIADYDVVILDFPAGIDARLMREVGAFSQFIAVCNPDPISVKDASIVCDTLEESGLSARLVLNRFTAEAVRKSFRTNIDDIIDNSGARLIGIVPYSDALSVLSVSHRIPRKSNCALAFSRIARRMLGEEIYLPSLKKI